MLTMLLVASALFASGDADADGLDDAWEQQVIERFAPRFILSEGECDHLPAEFAPNEAHPRPVARNGTVHAKATPWTGRPGAWVEIHYYHLWANGCGRMPHPLDTERVSVLLTGPAFDAPLEHWSAVYWFAAAALAPGSPQAREARRHLNRPFCQLRLKIPQSSGPKFPTPIAFSSRFRRSRAERSPAPPWGGAVWA